MASTMSASLPPPSTTIGVSVSAHTAMTFFAVAVDPLKASLSEAGGVCSCTAEVRFSRRLDAASGPSLAPVPAAPDLLHDNPDGRVPPDSGLKAVAVRDLRGGFGLARGRMIERSPGGQTERATVDPVRQHGIRP